MIGTPSPRKIPHSLRYTTKKPYGDSFHVLLALLFLLASCLVRSSAAFRNEKPFDWEWARQKDKQTKKSPTPFDI